MIRRRRLLLFAVYLSLIIGGWLAGRWLMDLTTFDIRPSNESDVHTMIMSATAIYALAAAIPFVPGAEVGLALIVAFGTPIVFLVYTSMVAALIFSYLVGRFVPARVIASLFDFLALTRARDLVRQMAPLGSADRLALLTAHAPRRIIPILIRHRFVALAAAINLPGNTLLGGGGGIALAAGMSGLYPLPAYLATIMIAVAPLPLLIWFTGYVP